MRGWLEVHRLAVKATEPLPSASGPAMAAARLAGRIPPPCWLRLSAGRGAKGRPWYPWSCVPLDATGPPEGWDRWLLVPRSLGTGQLAYSAGAGPAGLPLIGLVRVAGGRWRVEEALAGRQGAVRPGPAPGPPLALLVPLGAPGHAGIGVPGGGRGHRARPTSGSTRGDRVDLQRGPAPVCGPDLPSCRRSRAPVALVVVTTPPASPRSCLPLPTTSRPATMKITISGWSTSQPAVRP